MPHQGKAEGLPEPDQDNIEVIEGVEERDSGDHCPSHNEEISNNSANRAQPKSESNGASREDKTTKAVKGTYIAAPTIEEVRSAHADLQNIWKP